MLQRLVTRLALFLGALTAILANVAGAQQCCTGNVSTYCTAGTSVQGCVPQISGQGVPDTAAGSGFHIVVGQMPGQRMGLVFYSMSATALPQPWAPGAPGNASFICVYYPVARTGAQNSAGTAGACNGELRVDFNEFMAGHPSALGAPFTSGQQFFAQGWYRDPGSPKGTNLSNGLAFTLCTAAADVTPPVVTTCAANQVVDAGANCQGVVPDFTVGVVVSDNCTPIVLTQSPPAGVSVPVGATLVTITARDAAGNTSECVTTLTVVDVSSPVITVCAVSRVVPANSNCQGVVPDFTVGVVASDSCGGTVSLTQLPAAGTITTLGLGLTPVTITAADFVGNTSTCAATLSVMASGACQTPADFVAIQPGTFQMGEVGVVEPVHTVTISYQFWMSAKEVTQAQYLALMGSNPSLYLGSPNLPVEVVNWFDAREYCARLTAQQASSGIVPPGYEYRLPTEAEWEYACRAGTTTSWNVGNALSCGNANFFGGFGCLGPTSSVGSYPPNAWGLYDMHGNVREWCLDSMANYPVGAVTDPFVTGSPDRVFRGGSFTDYSFGCRSAFREEWPANDTNASWGDIGFRVVLGPILVP